MVLTASHLGSEGQREMTEDLREVTEGQTETRESIVEMGRAQMLTEGQREAAGRREETDQREETGQEEAAVEMEIAIAGLVMKRREMIKNIGGQVSGNLVVVYLKMNVIFVFV